MFWLSVFWVDHSSNLSVRSLGVQPFSTVENCGDTIGCVGDFHPLQQPPGAEARVVMLHSYSLQIAHVQHFYHKPIRLPAFKEVAKPLPQLPAAWISVGAVDGDKNIGICSCSLFITCDDDDFVLDGYQATSFACKTLNGLCALKGQVIISLWREWDKGIAVEDVPKETRKERCKVCCLHGIKLIKVLLGC